MILSLQSFVQHRSKCFKCDAAIVIEYQCVNTTYYRCQAQQGHYHAQLSPKEDYYKIDDEVILIKDVHYIHVDYVNCKVSIVDHASELVSIVVNLFDAHRADVGLVSRDGLEKLVHKASVVKHLR